MALINNELPFEKLKYKRSDESNDENNAEVRIEEINSKHFDQLIFKEDMYEEK
jgi:hypothetical protein